MSYAITIYDISLWSVHMWYRATSLYLAWAAVIASLRWLVSGSVWPIAITVVGLGAVIRHGKLWTILSGVATASYGIAERMYSTDRLLAKNPYSRVCDEFLIAGATNLTRSLAQSMWARVFSSDARCRGSWRVSYKLPGDLNPIS